ncbi:MAG: toll/interleukin-1 receptor domain-containing protein [Rhodomicrobiaceae bacterium]
MSDQAIEKWDIFISHASEDKASFVTPLAASLSAFGVNVWYDDYQLKLGDSLSRSIDKGLARSDFGLVVLSPAFFAKRWTEYELRGLTSRELSGPQIILPVWHNVSFEDVVQFSPSLADKLAVKTDGRNTVEIAVRIIEAIRPDIFTRIQRRIAWKLGLRTAALETVELDKLKLGPIRHPKLPDELIGRIRLVRACLLEVYPHSMEFWIDGFQRDTHPSGEVAIWEHIASVYREYIDLSNPLTIAQRKAAFAYLNSLSMFGESSPNSPDSSTLGLPEGGESVLAQMYKFALPIFDIKEEASFAQNVSNHPPDGSEGDLEHFPHDLPEDLIRELLS